MVVFAHEDGGPRRAAGTDQSRERRDDHDDRQTHAHTRQRKASVAGHVADVDTVDDVIEHVHKLRDHRRDGELAQGLSEEELACFARCMETISQNLERAAELTQK